MDQEQQFPAQLPAAPFPAPPPFWKHFTTENAERLSNIEAAAQHDAPSLPSDLVYLKPPPPPPETADSYTTFSIPQSLNPVPAPPPGDILLFDATSPQLDPARLLSQITRSLLLNFLELTTVLGNDPVQYEEKMVDINRLMLNAHFVINMYRPHQAREGVKDMLQARLEDGRDEIRKCDEVKTRVKAFLKSLDQGGSELRATKDMKFKSEGANGVKKSSSSDDGKKLWDLIHEIEEET